MKRLFTFAAAALALTSLTSNAEVRMMYAYAEFGTQHSPVIEEGSALYNGVLWETEEGSNIFEGHINLSMLREEVEEKHGDGIYFYDHLAPAGEFDINDVCMKFSDEEFAAP